MFRDSPLSPTGAANLFAQANSGTSQEEVQMTIVKAIFALILALSAITSTVNTFGGVTDPPKCFPCQN
jgi:hypothetical protein